MAKVRSDTDIFFAGLKSLVIAGLGAAVGSVEKDGRMIDFALMTGARSAVTETIIPVTVILAHDVEI
jgi:hypothetical protein